MVNTLAVDNETKQTIEALQAELKKTRAKLQAVEELKGQSGMYIIFSGMSSNDQYELLLFAVDVFGTAPCNYLSID